MNLDTDEKISALEKAFDDAKNRNAINRQRLANGEGVRCRICGDVVLPESLSDGVCRLCNGIIEQMLMRARVPIHRQRVEKMAFVIKLHAEALRRLSE